MVHGMTKNIKNKKLFRLLWRGSLKRIMSPRPMICKDDITLPAVCHHLKKIMIQTGSPSDSFRIFF